MRTIITEELKIKIDVDADTRDAQKLKNELKGIEGAAGGSAGGVSDASSAIAELQTSLKGLVAIESLDFLADHKEAFEALGNTIKQKFDKTHTSNIVQNLSNAFLSLDKHSKFYEDVEWENQAKARADSMQFLKNAIKDVGFGLSDIPNKAERAFKAIKNNALGALTAVRNLTFGIIAAGSLAGVLASFSASALGKDIYNTAQRVGMGTAKYQEWSYILQQTGADVTDLIGAQQTLTEAQIDVAEGAEDIIAAFNRIGLSAEEVTSMSRQELFERTIAGLQNIGNATERAAVGYKLLSEDASTLAALLGMSNQETAQLAANYQQLGSIMSGNLIKQSMRFQGALSNLRAAFQGITNTLAEVFLPIVIAVVQWVTKALAVINMFLRALFNLEITTSASGTNSSVGAGINGFGAMTDQIEEAEGAAQKLRRTLMGFDELNVVQNPNSSSGGSGGVSGGGVSGGVGDIGGIGESLIDSDALGLDKWQEWITKWKGVIQTIVPIALIGIGAVGAVLCLLGGNWVGALAFAAMAGIGFAVANVEGGLWDRLTGFLEKYNLEKIVPAAMVAIGAIGAVLCLLGGNIPGAVAFGTMAGIGFSLGGGSAIAEFVDKYETEIKKVIGITTIVIGVVGAAMALMTGNIPAAIALAVMGGVGGLAILTGGDFSAITKPMKQAWEDVKAWFNSNVKPIFTKQWWSNLFAKVGEGASAKLGGVRTTIINAWNNIKSYFLTNIAVVFTLAYWYQKFSTIGQGVKQSLGDVRNNIINAWNNIKSYFLTNIAVIFTLAYWHQKFSSIGKGMGQTLGEVRTNIMNAWNNIKSYFLTNIAIVLTLGYWLKKFNPIRAALSEELGAARTTVINGWNRIKDYFNKNIAPKFTVKYWTTKFNTIKDGAKSAFNGVISIVEKAVNGIITKMNTLSWKIPNWVPSYGGKSFGFNFKSIKIPRLAEGGIAVSSTLANIGENGREAVLPLDNNTDWMDALADKIAARSQGPTKLVLKVGEKELGWASIKGINQITKQTGELQLVL